MTYKLPDGTIIEWNVQTGRRGPSSADNWDTAEWDTAFWDGGTEVDFNRIPESLILSLKVKQGKDAFGKRYRAGALTLVLDNQDGLFTQLDTSLQPGDYVSVSVRILFPAGPPDEPIPDGWNWFDETGRAWTSHGDLVWADDTPDVPIGGAVFYGRVYSAIDTVRNGRDVTKVVVYDFFQDLAINQRDAVPAVGAGELSINRAFRITVNAGLDGTVGGAGQYEATMQETTLSGKALDQLHLTVETEGGDMFASNSRIPESSFGSVFFKPRDWLTTDTRSINVQFVLGGLSGIPIIDANISRELAIVVNNATFSNAGGVSQNSTDTVSVQRYGERTFRRLDLQGDQDTQAQFLAQRTVSALKDVRPRIREVTVPIVDARSAEFGRTVVFGDLVLTTVNSVNGWSYTALGHVIGKQQIVFEQTWHMILRLDDAFVSNVDGAFNDEMFTNAFTLGIQGG